ncbi:hypothetical protein BDP81DRAFT_425782 [Colletotrichum phormii]|uniref:BRCT domain-containing protein n=1 Tax=Colletotrichum phormii TaxID=359342 RepID=A0AAI9ZTV5_9PEZI|nr:uncharacterized protein BDP81DRAFT_425782 [Colletotrichum phormii]KAK1637740.1 hypothetical protein BDP81DRAFT_425782 [Colletotrichum phormii]
MDVSQQSPTQDNDDRDYENYYEGPSFVETSPISPEHSAEQHAIHEEDSAVVDFGNLDHLILGDTKGDEEPSSFPDHAAPIHTRGAWRNRTSSSQQQSSVQRTDGQSPLLPTAPPPQTPAQRHNPFAGKKLGDPALAGSQIFGQTQFSSAVKHFSPTSSRPSPQVYAHNSISPNIAETSPLKNRYNVTSPPDLLSSSPQVLRVGDPAPHDLQHSPGDSGPLEDGIIPESPQMPTANTRGLPEPIDIYENMLESQERKRKSAEFEAEVSGEESDDVAAKVERRKRAALKKKAAARDLTTIPVQRVSSNGSVEVPSTTRKSRKPPPRRMRYRARRVDDDSTASEDEIDGFTVADSQGHAADPQTRTRKSPEAVEAGNGAKLGLVSSNDAVPDSAGATQKSASNGVIPGTESSGNGSRPKDLIPETSPNNTQSRPEGRDDIPPDVLVEIKKSQQAEEPNAPVAEPKNTEPEAELLPETPEPSLPRPSRRSSRKSKPTLKAQILKGANSAAVSSDAAGTDEAVPPTKVEPDAGRASQETVATVVDKAIAIPTDVIPEVTNSIVNGEPPMPSSPPLPKAVNSVGPSDTVSKDSHAEQGPATPDVRANPAAPTAPGSTTSTLSVLTTTPVPSSKSPTASQESVELPSLSPDKSKRGRQPTKALPKLATGSRVTKQGTRKLRRATRLDSASTDELHRSPSVNGFENSIIQAPKTTARGSRLSMLSHTSKDNASKTPIFAGMAFAISFQSKKDGEKADHFEQRMSQSREMEKTILQCGGLLLSNGFDELFEPNALGSTATSPASETRDENPLTLTPFAQTIGFTALIADGHSRKVKYMQALALGLPCISDRWIATCVSKGAVVDWLPYLLCAGQSTFLRDAIRSRYLAPYSASEARLSDVVERRPKMLEGSQILLVMKKSRAEEKKMPYVFLAHVLGATLSRAYSVDEAKETLRQRELLEDPFDWVYVDEHTGSEEELFSTVVPASKPSKASKKRKRAAPATDDAPRPPKRIRTLSNELVIQSLILGRMIEEGEMEV